MTEPDPEHHDVPSGGMASWQPTLRYPVEIALVVDTAPSMEIWRRTTREFQDALRLAASVQIHPLDCSTPTLTRPCLPTTGRRATLVLTDTIGIAWHNGAVGALLAAWGRTMPVAVVQTMPERLWHWGALVPRRMVLSANGVDVHNSALTIAPVQPELGPAPRPTPTDVVLPVLAPKPAWLDEWLRLITVPDSGTATLTAVFVNEDVDTAMDVTSDEPTASAAELVRQFRAFASLDAVRLSGLLAAAPLNLDTIDLIQRVMLPDTDLDTQAEVMLGGLLRRSPDGSTGFTFDFHDGVREELLAGLSRAEAIAVVLLIDEQLGSRFPELRNFRAAIADPNGTEIPDLDRADRSLVQLQATVLRALSGPYARRRKVLTERLGGSNAPLESADRVVMTVSQSTGLDLEPTVASRRQIWGDVMPLRNPDFVGREDLLDALRQRLVDPGATAVLPEALHGMGGVGKTQTVAEYVHRHASEYDLIWWIAAEHPSQIRNSFVELARRLDLAMVAGAEGARQAVLDALQRGEPYSRWILLFDNADRPEAIMEFLPQGGPGHVVVTSRNPQWTGFARTVEVDLFTRAESTELLRRRGGVINDDEADQLAEALGDLPLAIEQAATWRAQTGMPVAEYLALLEENRTELLRAEAPLEYPLPVAAAWNVPLNHLRARHPDALSLLQICAFLSPEPISRRLFSGVPDANAPMPEALRDALNDPIKLNRAIREINRYSLATVDHRNNTLQLHRLVQAVLRTQVPDEDRSVIRHIAHMLLANDDPDDTDNSTNWPRYARLLPHARASGAVRCGSKWVRALLINLVHYLINIDDYASGLELAGQAGDVWRAEIGERDLQTLTMARHYGFILRRQLKFEQARECNRHTYELMIEEYGEDHEAVLFVADAVALDLRGEGRFVDELAMRQDIYARAVNILGDDDPQTLIHGFNLASALRQVGEYARARELDEDVHRRRLTTHGADHQRTFQSLHAIAMDLRECGAYLEACRMEEDAIARQREVLGDEYLGTVGALRNLAVARRKAGNIMSALELSTECYQRYLRRLGELHLDTITALMNMSIDERQLGDLVGAREHGMRSLDQYQKIYGPDHPYVHIAGTNLAPTLRLLGDADGALRRNKAAVSYYRSRFGPDHPSGLMMAANLASDLTVLGDLPGAESTGQDALVRARRVLGDDHPFTLACMHNLSLDLTTLGRTHDAAELHAEALAGFRRRLGDSHPSTTAAADYQRANCDTDTMQL